MKRHVAFAAAAAALALSGCQTTQTGANYVKVAPGPKVETAIAECKAISAKARHVVIGIGGPEALVVGLIGTAVATGVKQAQVFEQCMTLQGYGKVGAKPAPAGTAATPAAAPVAATPGKTPAVKIAPDAQTPKPAKSRPAPPTPKTEAPSPTA